MAYDKKLPSVRVNLKVEDYNKLLELLSNVEDIDIEEFKNKAEDIKDKALKYAQPKEDNNILMRFYPSQMEILVYILLFNSKKIEVSEDYYKRLITNRENYKKQFNETEEGGNE